jgi:hypothetical protein
MYDTLPQCTYTDWICHTANDRTVLKWSRIPVSAAFGSAPWHLIHMSGTSKQWI